MSQEGEKALKNEQKRQKCGYLRENSLSLQILEGVEARGLIWDSHTPLGEGGVLENPF